MLLACIIACSWFDFGGWQCVYERVKVCPRPRQICVESKNVTCVDWVKPLGPWSPVPADYTPAPATSWSI